MKARQRQGTKARLGKAASRSAGAADGKARARQTTTRARGANDVRNEGKARARLEWLSDARQVRLSADEMHASKQEGWSRLMSDKEGKAAGKCWLLAAGKKAEGKKCKARLNDKGQGQETTMLQGFVDEAECNK